VSPITPSPAASPAVGQAPEAAAQAAATPAEQARAVMRAADRAALATLARPGTMESGAPYASLVLVALDHDASPLLLVSQLADHTKNLQADGRVSLLFDGTAGLAEPLTGPRVTLQGTAAPSDDKRLRARFLARHPGAALYADFRDFGFWRVAPGRAHLVAGFGRIHWIDALRLDTAAAAALAEAEPGIIAHMNRDHTDAVQLYATKLLGRAGGGWTMTGVDPEGCDLRREGEVARLPFGRPVLDADAARAELVRLVKHARAQG
jgi:putative heme iron utilization protein